jgi:hypothetical protein
VYVELKKKYKGVVYKRRIAMTLAQARQYLSTACRRQAVSDQREIDYFMNAYPCLAPSALFAIGGRLL